MNYKAEAANYIFALMIVLFCGPALIWGFFGFLYVILGMILLGLFVLFWLVVLAIVEFFLERSE